MCDSSTSINSLSNNFSSEIFEFINERGSHPGIPLFHNYRQHHLSSFDDGFLNSNSIHIKLNNLSLMLKYHHHISINQPQKDEIQQEEEEEEEEDFDELKERLSKIYKTKDALENALKNMNIKSHSKKKKTVSNSKQIDKETQIEFDIESIKDRPIPIYLQCEIFIYHGDENDNIDYILNNKQFEPNLVSDFININAADWNRLFYWTLITEIPIGYVHGNDHNQCKKLKDILDDKLQQNDIDHIDDNDNNTINILNSFQISKYFRLQSTNDISMWKVIQANEVTL